MRLEGPAVPLSAAGLFFGSALSVPPCFERNRPPRARNYAASSPSRRGTQTLSHRLDADKAAGRVSKMWLHHPDGIKEFEGDRELGADEDRASAVLEGGDGGAQREAPKLVGSQAIPLRTRSPVRT